MPFRKLPNTDTQRIEALRALYSKAGSVAPEDLAFSAANYELLQTFYPNFRKEIEERGSALSDQSESTILRNEAEQKCRMYVSHFYQVFNLGIDRGIYNVNERAYFNIDISSETLPDLRNGESVTTQAEYIIKGDADRTAAGGAVMSNPSTAEVESVFNDYAAKLTDQSNKKDMYEKEVRDVDNLRQEADIIIKDIWDEIEFGFRKDEPSVMRRKAREYGVIYATRPGEPDETEQVPDNETLLPEEDTV